MPIDKLINNLGLCGIAYNLTGKPKYLNCLIENKLDNGKIDEARSLFDDEFMPKTLDRTVNQHDFAYTYFLYGEYLLRKGQITNAKREIKKGFDLAISSKKPETPKMLRRIIEQGVYKQFKDDLDFQKLEEQIAIKSMENFNTKNSMINYLSRGNKERYELVKAEIGLQ